MPLRPLSVLLAFALPVAAFAQGALTPPGAPAPTMKSLTELDASLTALSAKADTRIAVEDLTGDASNVRVISAPGSYYLRGNFSGTIAKSGIRITASNVVLDLNGFALTGGAGSSTGVIVSAGVRQVIIRNGTIATWSQGIGGGTDILVSDVQVRGCTLGGINLAGQGIVHHAQVADCGVVGINAGLVTDSTVTTINATSAGADGIIATLARDCRVDGVTSTTGAATGISARIARGCGVLTVSGSGVTRGISAGVVESCTVGTITGTSTGQVNGINSDGAVSDCEVRSVTAASATAIGISAGSASNCRIDSVSGTTGLGVSGGDAADGLSVSNITGTTAAGTGISATAVRGCRVDVVTAATSCGGIVGETVQGCRVSSLTAETFVLGINTGTISGSVADSTVNNLIGGTTATATVAAGIQSPSVTNCTVQGLTLNACTNGRGINGVTVQGCTVRFVTSNAAASTVGVVASNVSGCTIVDIGNLSAAPAAAGIGIMSASIGGAANTGLLERNTVTACSHAGINATGVNRVIGNVCENNGPFGILTAGGSTVTDNHTRGHTTFGYSIIGSGNFVARNVSVGDIAAFSISATSRYAPIIVGAGAGVAFDANANVDL